jgi:hypothetical protein
MKTLLFLGAWLLAAAASAAEAPPPRRDPLLATTPVPPLTYKSPFAGFRALDDKTIPWRQANETANAAGGWRAYAREAQAPAPAASAVQPQPQPQAKP